MDSKTRVLTALTRQKPDRVPFNFWMDRRLMAQYEQEINHRHWRVTHFGADVIETFAAIALPTGKTIEQDGTVWTMEAYLKSWDNADEIQLPDPNDDKVYDLIKQDLKEFPDKAIFLDMATTWGGIATMRTYDNIYMDMYERPAEFKKLSSRIMEMQKTVVDRACKLGITALYLMEDVATSQGLSMSPAMIDEFCFEFTRPLIEIARSYDIPVLWHSDGMILDIIEPLKELGICAVNPLQSSVNDISKFATQFSSETAVYGGLDNCFIIPDGTVAEVEAHVINVFETLGKDTGGLIFSTHDIPLHAPKENVEAMVNTIKRCTY